MKKFRIRNRLKSFGYAWKGIRSFVVEEHNAWIHLTIAAAVVIAGFWFQIQRWEWIAILLCMALVLAAEAFNTAIERWVDLVSPHHHPLAGNIKDIAAGAVLICAFISVLVGAIVFIPYL